ncbi:hypothetical protein O4215_20750 [Rhodococcus maanshanensis]|uniref:DUF7257 domain-containing protein n=1 Tax=Rhodococcus maanshanensis TaxID=183556 RepID=UPI0022B5608E|nr:hypothetical protein [Rhodococcus maanshanensis]MCZ4557995.1 hypothetical protein [Rhodococcus maanshanensis]
MPPRITPEPKVNVDLAHLLSQKLGNIPVIGDLVEVITGIEDGDLNDLGSWANNLKVTIDQIGEIFQGLVVTPINNAVQRVKDWFLGLLGWKASTSTSVTTINNNVTNQGRTIAGVETGLSEVERGLITKSEIGDVPNNIGMWQTMNPLEDPTFPRILLDAAPKWIGGGTSQDSHNAFGTHAHTVFSNSAPFHDTTKDVLHLGFIRAPRNRVYNTVGFIVAAEGNPCPMYVAVYRMRSDGSLECAWVSPNIASIITPQKSEVRLDLDVDVVVKGGDYLAVGILQTGAGNARKLASVAMDPVAVPALVYPPKINAARYIAGSPPDTIATQDIDFQPSAVMWMCLGQRPDNGPKPFLRYSDDFERPNAGHPGQSWAVRGPVGISAGRAAVPDGSDGFRTALWVYPLNYDDQVVTMTIDAPSADQPSFVALRANNLFTRGMACAITSGTMNLARLTGVNTFTVLNDTIVNRQFNAGDRIEFSVRAWTYTVRVNGQKILTWIDTAHAAPRGPEYRFVGFGLYRSWWINSAALRDWSAADIPLPQPITLGMAATTSQADIASLPADPTVLVHMAKKPDTRTWVKYREAIEIPAAGIITAIEGVVWCKDPTAQIAVVVRLNGTTALATASMSTAVGAVVANDLGIVVAAGDRIRLEAAAPAGASYGKRITEGALDGSKTHLHLTFQPDEELPPDTGIAPYPSPDRYPSPDEYPAPGK